MANKKLKMIFLLFGISVFVYFVLDIWSVSIFRPLFIMPVYPVVGLIVDRGDNPVDFILRALSFSVNLFLCVLPALLFQKAKNIYYKVLCCLFGMAVAVWYIFLTSLFIFWENGPADIHALIGFSLLGGIGLFYVFFTVLFYKILNEKKVIPDVMKEQIQKEKKKLILLFVIPIVAFFVLDICLGAIFHYILTAPLIAQEGHHEIGVVLRTMCFAIILCLWSYPIFLFHITRNVFFKILSCFLGTVNAAWFAFWAWVAIYGWGSKFPPRESLIVEDSVRPYVFAGVALFYIGFAVGLYWILYTKKQSAVEGSELVKD